MPAFGDRFINLAEFEPSGTLRSWDCSFVLNDAIRVLMGEAADHTANRSNPGGTIYLPPGRWPVGLYSAAPVVIPAEIELMVAPGAVIVPHNFFGTPEALDTVLRPALEVHGELNLPGDMFIATAATETHYRDTVDLASNLPLFPVGWVSFPTQAIEAVHPEWWGVGSLADDDDARPAVDTAALEAALRSALFRDPWSDLVTGGAQALQGAPLAIEILTQVQLANGVLIGGRAWYLAPTPHPVEIVVPSVDGLVLRGRRGSTKPHIVGRVVGDEPQVVLLASAYPDGLRFQDLWLDAGVGFLSDLLVMFAYRGEGSRLDAVDCTFTGRALRLVWSYMLDDFFRQPLPLAASPSSPFTTGAWVGDVTPDHLSFAGCRFAPSFNQDGLPTALWVHAAAVTVDVSDSTFSGPSRAMVIVGAGGFRANNCTFANTATPGEWFVLPPRDRDAVPESGVDVLIPGALFAPVNIELVNCVSMSYQFLAMAVAELVDQRTQQKRSGPFYGEDGRFCSARVVNCVHEAELTLIGAASRGVTLPSPIYWGSDKPTTFSLTLLGCRLGENVAHFSDGGVRKLPPGKVAVREPNDQRIYDAWLLPPGPRYEVWNSTAACNIVTLAPRTVSSP